MKGRARVVKSVNTIDLKSIAVWLAGSSPAPGIMKGRNSLARCDPLP